MIKKLHELNERQFAYELHKVVSHSRPIDDERHLKGREEQMKLVAQAIHAPGRNVFVFGERGVGKTSLAKTAGIRAADGNENFRHIGCSSNLTFDELMRLVINSFDQKALENYTRTLTLGSHNLGLSRVSTSSRIAPSTISVSAAADMLANLDNDGMNTRRVVVVDEVDRLVGDEIRRDIAELMKLLGDRSARITFIFTGVGHDLDHILGSHASSFRQIAQIPLDRISYQSALDIIDDALSLFGLSWEAEPTRTARFRIASIANGFPYYVHLLVEKLLWLLWEDKQATEISFEHLRSAIEAAVKDAQQEIRKAYDKATRGRADRYRHVVWAVADSWLLERSSQEIYGSYIGISRELGSDPIEKNQAYSVLGNLRKATCGYLLKNGYRKGQYEFKENIVRGYARLCASAEGVELRDLGPDPEPKLTAQGKSTRYVDPRRFGGPPKGFRTE